MSASGNESDGHGDGHGRMERLQQVLVTLKEVKSENAKLRSNFQNLSKLHSELKRSHSEADRDKSALQADFLARESQLTGKIEQLADELDQSYRQFEEAKSYILTQDEAKALEEQLRSEIESPFLERIRTLDSVIQSKIAENAKLWKSNEELGEEIAQSRRRFDNELGAQKSRYQILIETLEESNIRLRSQHQGPGDAQRTTTELEAKVFALEQQAKHLSDSLEREHGLRCRADAAHQKSIASFAAAQSEWKEAESSVTRRAASSERRSAHLASELEKQARRVEALKADVLDAEDRGAAALAALASLEMQRRLDKDAVESERVALQATFAKEKEALAAIASSCEKRLALRESEGAKQIRALEDGHLAALDVLRQAKAEAEELRAEESGALRARVAELEARVNSLQVECSHKAERLSRADSAAGQLKAENSALAGQVADLERESKAAQSELETCKADAKHLAREREKQAERHTQLAMNADRLERDNRKLRMDGERLEDALREHKREHDQQLKTREQDLEATKRNFALERLATSRQFEEDSKASIKRYASINAKMKYKLTKSEESVNRLEREYTVLLIRLAELEAENKEFRSQLTLGFPELSSGNNLGIRSYLQNFRDLSTEILRRDDRLSDDPNVDDNINAYAMVDVA